MYSQYYALKPRVVTLRKAGKTYGEIQRSIGEPIPKSTLSHWFRGILLTKNQQEHISRKVFTNIRRAQAKARLVNEKRRREYIQGVRDRVIHLSEEIRKKNSAKIALAMLYLGEGAKRTRGSLMFGNSDPLVIRLYLNLLRSCYSIDENKFRCTLQCRADQNIKKLEKFWSNTTKIPPKRFYKAQIDSRTIGKPSRNPKYKGVCRIDYFSADIFNELVQTIKVICMGL
tara:strand:- start:425 stop:1108 length:684 start_codon:yes stop_codon:yes gene_type:complete